MDRNWTRIKAAYSELRGAGERNGDMDRAWDQFAAICGRDVDAPPYHLSPILGELARARGDRPKRAVRILDHGCGGGLTLLYLLARGYTGIYGVDIGGEYGILNAVLAQRFQLTDPRFWVYDGERLPFEDGSFDFVFSQEVIEHVRPDALDAYYAEERRVLKPGGLAFHRVPHRLAPFEAHTQQWLVHYLPRPIWLGILRARGHDIVVPETALFLRWPWVHRRMARRYLGNCEDHTIERFVGLEELTYYEGPKGLRRLVARLMRLRIVGSVARVLLANFLMLDTVSRVRS